MKPVLICAQPCNLYYAWQIEVMLTNFRELELYKYFEIQCVFSYHSEGAKFKEHMAMMQKVQNKFANEATFHYYHDIRENTGYISSIRPNVLKQHFKYLPMLSQCVVFYHDCDIIFSKFPDFIFKYIGNDSKWYVSDTKSYISSEYIKSKGNDIFQNMCEIVGIHPAMVSARDEEAGGAQYIMKGVDWMFWEKVEKDCSRLFNEITPIGVARKIQKPSYHELQIWCADMWAVLWNAWMRGYTTEIIPEMEFTWTSHEMSKFDDRYIFHNAGVTEHDKERMFYKNQYTDKLPYFASDEMLDKTRASYKYFQLLKRTGEESCLIN